MGMLHMQHMPGMAIIIGCGVKGSRSIAGGE
jgi:hypothetical protein